MPHALSDETMNALTEALLHGRKIEAIKIYREVTGLGLKESKDAIEEIETSLRAKFPEKFAAASPKTNCGCLAIGAMAVAGILTAAYWFLRGRG